MTTIEHVAVWTALEVIITLVLLTAQSFTDPTGKHFQKINIFSILNCVSRSRRGLVGSVLPY